MTTGRAIDWTDLRERMARLASAERVEPAREAAVLAERARRLARAPEILPGAGEVLEFVVFRLGRERFALEAVQVASIVPLRDYTPVPGTPAVLLGITNLRGEVLAIADLRHLLGVAAPGLTEWARVLVLGTGAEALGILADGVDGALSVHRDAILPLPEGLRADALPLVRGVTADAVVLLDGAALLADPRLQFDQTEAP